MKIGISLLSENTISCKSRIWAKLYKMETNKHSNQDVCCCELDACVSAQYLENLHWKLSAANSSAEISQYVLRAPYYSRTKKRRQFDFKMIIICTMVHKMAHQENYT